MTAKGSTPPPVADSSYLDREIVSAVIARKEKSAEEDQEKNCEAIAEHLLK